jgi:hypothetical protein
MTGSLQVFDVIKNEVSLDVLKNEVLLDVFKKCGR